jgi:hypothetical protein
MVGETGVTRNFRLFTEDAYFPTDITSLGLFVCGLPSVKTAVPFITYVQLNLNAFTPIIQRTKKEGSFIAYNTLTISPKVFIIGCI